MSGRKLGLRVVALGYLAVILVAPLLLVVWRTFVDDASGAWEALSNPETVHAFKVTLEAAAIAVPLNTVFGILCGLAIVRRRFPGKGLVNAFVDLPLAISPVVVGLALFLLYGRTGWFGSWLTAHGYQVLFALPAIVMATVFVSVPFVAREVIPTLREIGDEQEQAAHTLGASSWQTFWRITLPSIRWAVVYGVVLDDGALPRRVRRGRGRVGIDPGEDRDRHPARAGGVREPEHGRGLRDLARPGRDRGHHADPDVDREATRGASVVSISVRNVSKRFGDFAALDDVSVEVETGSLTALLGPSGSGKSTLLRVIAGLETPDSGTVAIEGREMTGRRPQDRGVGFVFQHYAAFKHMTVYQNVAFGLSIRKRSKDEIRRRVAELLELVQLDGLSGRYPSQLSGGQRQRMGLARALAVDPSVLLLDEPFGALDARVRTELRAWLRRLHDETRTTTVIVTHDQEEAMEVADEVVVMHRGKVEQVAGPRELYDRPANEFVMTFVGQANRVGDAFVRPHDLELTLEPNGRTREAMIERIVHLGFEVRVDLVREDGERIFVQLTRDEVEQLELEQGQIVFVSPTRQTTFG